MPTLRLCGHAGFWCLVHAMALIALMTDFGTRDHYVAAMKGVILQIDPKATVVDVTHEIDPQDILHGAFVLRQVVPYFPVKTIFVAVVDPTVGTARRILAARYSDRLVIAPDNGLLTLLHRDAEFQAVRVVENRRYFAATLSGTFHGRDIMAPVAAHISRGTPLDHLGSPADHIEILGLTKPRVNSDGSLEGEVLFVDHFGNLITNISVIDLSAARTPRPHVEVWFGERRIGPVRTAYAEVPEGDTLALVGSAQMLEIAVNRGHAAKVLAAGRGARVTIR